MSKKANPVTIGTFVVVALALAAAVILIIGDIRLNKKTYRCVLYFKGSLHGLDVGAPVTYSGVAIGRVGDMTITFDEKLNNFRIPVYIDIDENTGVDVPYYEAAGFNSTDDFFRAMIQQGLRAKLKMRSLLTGKLYIEFAFSPDTEAQIVNPKGKYLEIPTLPSGLDQITQTLETLPLKEMIEKTVTALDGINNLVNSEDLKNGLASLNSTLTHLDTFIVHADAELAPLVADLKKTLADLSTLTATADHTLQKTQNDVLPIATDLRRTLANIDNAVGALVITFENIQTITSEDSLLYYQVTKSLQEVADAARSVGQLSDYLQRRPNALLFGQKEDD